MSNDFITTEIKGRKIVYFLTSKDDIDNLKRGGIFSDICLCLFSICAGGVLSIFIGKQFTTTPLPTDLLRSLQIANTFMWIGGIIFLIFYAITTFRTFTNINNLTKSGTIESFGKTQDTTSTEGLLITFAEYYTKTKWIDITQRLNSMIKDNRLKRTVGNEMTGTYIDPHPGTAKQFKIRYTYNGKSYEKDYNEGDSLDLP